MPYTPPPPASTYRFQINKDFTLRDAAAQVPYLKRLGITHVYLSPIFEAEPGSNHGYDNVDPTRISQERGGMEGLKALDKALQDNGMGMIIDIVPNHMGVSKHNPFWWNYLEKGEDSEFAEMFHRLVPNDEKLHVPVLGEKLEDVIRSGQMTVKEEGGRIGFHYYDHAFPLNEKSRERYAAIKKEKDTLTPDDVLELMEMQSYKPVYWEEAHDTLGYRRFFDITGLICLNIQIRKIFNVTHRLVANLPGKLPSISGYRIDHVDGLLDPGKYLTRLKDLLPDGMNIWVEKILGHNETLPKNWPVAGTTGYEYISRLLSCIGDAAGYQKIAEDWRTRVRPGEMTFADTLNVTKRKMLEETFTAEMSRLTGLARTALPAYDDNTLREALICLTVALPNYRTYFTREDGFSAEDKTLLAETFKTVFAAGDLPDDVRGCLKDLQAKLENPAPDTYDFIEFWQQISGPAMAKGLEDTAHYRYTPNVAWNEVGCEGDPKQSNLEKFCAHMNQMAEEAPETLTAGSTHDTKRSEDVRHRLVAMTARPEEWIHFLEFETGLSGGVSLNPHTRHLLYQMLAATFMPHKADNEDYMKDYVARIQAYMQKALRERKVESSWTAQNTAYEKSTTDFIETILKHEPFVEFLSEYTRRLSWQGALTSLSATCLRILGPGIPDIYQGTENWDDSTLDPDNRRKVNYKENADRLSSAENETPEDLCATWRNGEIKAWLTQQILRVRAERGAAKITMTTLECTGARANDIAAVLIETPDDNHNPMLLVAPRNGGKFEPENKPADNLRLRDTGLENTEIILPADIAPEQVRNIFTRDEISCEDGKLNAQNCLERLPVALFCLG